MRPPPTQRLPRRRPALTTTPSDTTSARQRPVSVAITGGIGTGKSTALRAFARQGAATVSSDEIVHHLLRNDPSVKQALLERLGDGILGEDGEIDRARVGSIVFGNRELLAWLEGLLHPLVSAEYLRWRAALAELPNPPAVAVTEVPLLYEAGGEGRFDAVVAITASPRLRERRGRPVPPERDSRLLPDEEKLERADYAYVNNRSVEDLDAFVATVMSDLQQRDPNMPSQ